MVTPITQQTSPIKKWFQMIYNTSILAEIAIILDKGLHDSVRSGKDWEVLTYVTAGAKYNSMK